MGQHDATVTFSASYAESCYTVDGGEEQAGNSVTLGADGVHTIVYWSVDKAGNAEEPHTITVKIDKTAPSFDLCLSETVIWPPNHKMVPVQASVSAEDTVQASHPSC
ncbi:hypothetical protein [Paenibacillus sp. FSL W8-0194]|uniref:OmpL47-type beta-barrel domain-containing protein n=1 Tax=Paenibacillus sp. FSL W8-0194 TaxID=2921711 RepID=UPI0030DC748C